MSDTLIKKKGRSWTAEEKAAIGQRMRENHAKRKAAKAKKSEAIAVNSFNDHTEPVKVNDTKLTNAAFSDNERTLLGLLKQQIHETSFAEGFEAGFQKGTAELTTTVARMPQYEPKWANRDFMVCMPMHRETNGATLFSLMALAMDFGVHGMRFDAELGDGVIANARNKLAHRFLGTGATWSLWIDADMVPPVGRAGLFRTICHLPGSYPDKNLDMHVAHRLLSHNKTIVGATYFGRNETGAPMFSEGLYNADANKAAREMVDGIRETDWVATGCVLIHKQVFLDIQKKFPELGPKNGELHYKPKMQWKDMEGNILPEYIPGATPEVLGHEEKKKIWTKHWDFFRTGEGEDGEDVAFFARAKAAGHQCWVDTGLQAFHVGNMPFGSHNTRNNVEHKKSVSGLF